MGEEIKQVEAMDSGKKNSEVLESTKKASTVMMGESLPVASCSMSP